MRIRLLSTDFDGTLIGHAPDGPCAAELAEALTSLRESGAWWAINTGRQLWFILEGLETAGLPHDPDFFLTSEREIFRPAEDGGWVPLGGWNEAAERRHADLYDRAGPLLEQVRAFAARHEGIEMLYEHDRFAGLWAVDEATMDQAVACLRELSAGLPEFSWNRNDVWLRFAHREIHKGSTLAALAHHLGVPREEVLAVGDHFNDLPMLDGGSAAMVACPANAIPEVKQAVRHAGGYISPKAWGEGVADAIRHFSHLPPR